MGEEVDVWHLAIRGQPVLSTRPRDLWAGADNRAGEAISTPPCRLFPDLSAAEVTRRVFSPRAQYSPVSLCVVDAAAAANRSRDRYSNERKNNPPGVSGV